MNNGLFRWLLDVERIPVDAETVRLAWERPFPAWVWLVLILAAGAFAVWSYARLSGERRGRGVLALVRTLVILLVLVLVSGPMLEVPRETVEEDWLLLLADRSQSMQIADAGPENIRRTRDQQLRMMLDETADVWRSLDANRHLLWLGFHDGAFDLRRSPDDGTDGAPDPGGASGGGAGMIELGEATGRQTNLNAALEQALQMAAARPVSGVVIFSDGRTNDPPTRSVIRRLQAEQIGVYVVPLGSDRPLGDLAVRRVDAPRRAFVRDKVPVTVELDRFGEAVRDMRATIRLVDVDVGRVLDEVDLAPGAERDAVTLTAEPSEAGESNWRVEIETPRADLIPDNNLKVFNIELVDRPLRVLYVDGYPRWEYRYLKWLLIREKSIESSIMLLSADRDFAQEGNAPITRLPRSPEEFAEFDVIILGDVPGSFFSPSQLDMIRDHVAERGAGLLWIGGPRSTPSSYTGASAALADLLPIRGALSLGAIDEPVNMIPTSLADRLGVLRLVSAGEVGWPEELADPRFDWSQLQWAQAIDPDQLKPTAQPLATTLDTFGGSRRPLVVYMRYGAGQTIYVATDEIWRWRYGRGELLPEQFWVQIIRMLGRETLTASGAAAVLEADPRRIAVGQPMRIGLRIVDARLADQGADTVRAEVVDESGAIVAELELDRVESSESEYATTYMPDTAGAFQIRVDDPVLLPQMLITDAEVYNPENELRRPETDHALLEQLASQTGGAVLNPGDLASLAESTLLPNRAIRTPNPLTERIWDTPLFFILVLLAITGEWIGRKLLRLA